MSMSICSIAKNRVRFWHNIWNSCNRPREGYVYSSYKLAKKTYRKVCNTAVNVKIYSEFNTISNLHLCKRSGKMWNLIRTLRRGKNNTQGDIEMDDLEKFYSLKNLMTVMNLMRLLQLLEGVCRTK